MKDKYVAAMVLAGVGDSMGYKCGEWEFCYDGKKIHKEVKRLGGVRKLDIKKPDFIVSDDTVLLLSTAEALVQVGSTDDLNKIYSEIAFHYQKDYLIDMNGRAGGMTTQVSCARLKPLEPDGWIVPFNVRGGGCGATMRAMCIGLRYPNVFDTKCLEQLIAVSVESGRMTHNHPTGYLGSFASALFGALAVVRYPLHKWGSVLMSCLPKVKLYIKKCGRDVAQNEKAWSYFQEKWTKYLTDREILQDNADNAVFPAKYTLDEREVYYKSLSFNGWAGASGHDAPMLAYDGLLAAKDNWIVLCEHAMLHGGDNDSTGVIAGFCYGAMYGLDEVPSLNYNNVEYKHRLTDAGEKLFAIATQVFGSHFSTGGKTISFEILFK